MSDMNECSENKLETSSFCSMQATPKFSEVTIGDVCLSPSETLILFGIICDTITERREEMADGGEMEDDLKTLIAIRFLLVESC